MKELIIVLLILTATSVAYLQEIEENFFIPSLKENSERYYYFPFDVPENTKSVVVKYSYDKKGGANTLDLGVFDTNFDESEKSPSGFRGWSGGRRNEIFIAENAATNGYVAGKINKGKWRVIFGLYKIAPEGVEVKISVKFNKVEEKLLNQPREESEKAFILPKLEKLNPAPSFNGLKWFRGDLHIHTFHSDGNWTFPLIFEYANKLGLDFLGLTEHNTVSHHQEINRLSPKFPNLLILRGEEVTTYGGHFNVWGLPTGELIDFRVTPNQEAELSSSLNQVRQLGLIASLNHPIALCGGCSWGYGDWTKMDSIEIWNGDWDATDELALKQWDKILQQGKRLAIIGSSDTHQPSIPERTSGNPSLSEPTNHVGMKKLSQNELLGAVKKGRTWVSDLPKNYQLEFSALAIGKRLNLGDIAEVANSEIKLSLNAENFPAGASVLLISNGQIVRNDNIRGEKYKFEMSLRIDKNSYFRIEIRDANNKMLALTNPIYFKKKQ